MAVGSSQCGRMLVAGACVSIFGLLFQLATVNQAVLQNKKSISAW